MKIHRDLLYKWYRHQDNNSRFIVSCTIYLQDLVSRQRKWPPEKSLIMPKTDILFIEATSKLYLKTSHSFLTFDVFFCTEFCNQSSIWLHCSYLCNFRTLLIEKYYMSGTTKQKKKPKEISYSKDQQQGTCTKILKSALWNHFYG